MTFGAQLLNTRFTSFPERTCTIYSAGRRRSPMRRSPATSTGNRLPFAPKLKFNLGANRQVSLGRSGTCC